MSKKKKISAEEIHEQIISTRPFKLRDGATNNHQFIDLKTEFGYSPRAILIEKVRGRNNVMVVSAVNDEIWAMILKKAGKKEEDLIPKRKEVKNGKLKSDSGAQSDTGKKSGSSKRKSG